MACTSDYPFHCESCGSEDEATEHNDGYSSCCNEPIVHRSDCEDEHGRNARIQSNLDAAVAEAGYVSRDAWMDADMDGWRAVRDAIFAQGNA